MGEGNAKNERQEAILTLGHDLRRPDGRLDSVASCLSAGIPKSAISSMKVHGVYTTTV